MTNIKTREQVEGNAETKIIPYFSDLEIERDFARAWEDAHSTKWRHPADGIRVFIHSLRTSDIKTLMEEVEEMEIKEPVPVKINNRDIKGTDIGSGVFIGYNQALSDILSLLEESLKRVGNNEINQ